MIKYVFSFLCIVLFTSAYLSNVYAISEPGDYAYYVDDNGETLTEEILSQTQSFNDHETKVLRTIGGELGGFDTYFSEEDGKKLIQGFYYPNLDGMQVTTSFVPALLDTKFLLDNNNLNFSQEGQVNYDFSGQSLQTTYDFDINLTVTGVEQVTVPMGTFNALVLESKGNMKIDTNTESSTTTLYVVEELGAVKRVINDGENTETFYMVDTNLTNASLSQDMQLTIKNFSYKNQCYQADFTLQPNIDDNPYIFELNDVSLARCYGVNDVKLVNGNMMINHLYYHNGQSKLCYQVVLSHIEIENQHYLELVSARLCE